MCRMASFVVTRESVFWSKSSDSHKHYGESEMEYMEQFIAGGDTPCMSCILINDMYFMNIIPAGSYVVRVSW